MSGDYDSSSRTFYLVSFSISNEVYTEMSLSKKILGGLEGNMLVGVFVLDGMLCAYSTYDHATIPKRFADGEVLFWVRHVFHKMRRSIMTLIGPFRIPDAIGKQLVL
ncbi:hypothetical protein R3W88_027878 [Solanum pinnatisectum]|uniref:Uncharacterized protein n=1 Tax=Solanum pinnatisectum TaxID=50273 RepID=A0AAV9LIK1_9SOLN|nr:hypothetical protein R3W88_027878 [Solanum pinnatisectum]